MDIALLKQSHEDRFLEAGYYLALQFKTGWVVSRILGREWANLRPYSVGEVKAGANLSAWNEIKDTTDKHYLEPSESWMWYHTFWGINTPNARVFVQFPTKAEIGSLVATDRVIDGDVGYIPGEESPYEGPFSQRTELITVKERYPAFQIYDPTLDDFPNVLFHFDTRKYTYQLIKDKRLIEELLLGKRQCKKFTVGPIDPQPTPIPMWLESLVTPELIKWTQDLMQSESAGLVVEQVRGQLDRRTELQRYMAHFGVDEVTARKLMAAGVKLPPRGTGGL